MISNSLLESLQLYTELYHKPYTKASLIAGLPMKKGSDSIDLYPNDQFESLFKRAALNANLKSKLVEISLDELAPEQLPVIILTSSKQSVIIDSFDDEKTKAKVVVRDNDGDIIQEWIGIEKLKQEYAGSTYLLKQLYSLNQEQKLLKSDLKHWFWSTIGISKKIYIDVLFASILVNIFILATPLFTMNVYDRVIPNNSTETLTVFAIGVLLAYTIDFFAKQIRAYFLEIAAKKSDVIISSMLFERVMWLKMSHFPASVGSFANNLKDFDSLRSFLTNATLAAFIDFPFVVIFLAVIFYIGGPIVIVPIVIIIFLLIFGLLIKKPLQRHIEELHQIAAQKSGILIESLHNIETIKTLGISSHMQWTWEETVGKNSQIGLKMRVLSAIIPNITNFAMQLGSVLVVVYGVFLIKDFELTMGGLIAVVILTSRALAPMGQVTSLITNYQDAKTSFETIDSIFELPSEKPHSRKYVQTPPFSAEIEFKNVSFSYPNAEVKVLDNVSFKINRGEKVGFIGRIGSGKTTIQKLLLRLYEPTEGTILIDGIDINQINPVELRDKIGYVSQDVHLFRGTLKENITYRYQSASDDEIRRSAKVSGIDEFIKKHPLGYDLPIGENGVGVSGGQKQAIAISRAFLKAPSIMLMDEPTTGMDQLSENRVIESFKRNLNSNSALIITQKMNLLECVERIIVMSEGRVYLDNKKEIVLQALAGEK